MPTSLQFALHNASASAQVYSYVSGIDISSGQRCLVKPNGDLYFPRNPPSIGSPLTEDVAIPLGPPGSTTNITVPRIAGEDCALVEPSVLNPSDPNAQVDFGFCEFTLNDAQFYANISYVDFVPRLPIAIALETRSGPVQMVTGMPPEGLTRVCKSLQRQAQTDGKPWDRLVVTGQDGTPLRALNATHGGAVNASFDGYYEPYINSVWQRYQSTSISVNTQAAAGVVTGTIDETGNFVIGGEHFSKPTSADVFGCNSGPFTTGPSQLRNAIIPRLAAAFVRSTILDTNAHPSSSANFYKHPITNHYARIVHEQNIDGKGYSFAYDDVQPDGGDDESGKVNAGDPVLFRVTFGGTQGGAQSSQTDVVGGRGQVPLPASGQHVQQSHAGFRDRFGGLMQKVLR